MNQQYCINVALIDTAEKTSFITNLIPDPCRNNLKLIIHNLHELGSVIRDKNHQNYNFHYYDIIIFTINIKDALNTTNLDILKFIFEQVELNKQKYNIITKLIILVNKCDKKIMINNNLILDDTNEKLYTTIQNIIITENKTNVPYQVMPISSKNALMYNLLTNVPENLMITQINKMGIYFFGNIYWAKLNSEEKRSRLIDYSKNNCEYIYKTLLLNSGYLKFQNAFNNLFADESYLELVLNSFKNKFMEDINECNNNELYEHKNLLDSIKKLDATVSQVEQFFKSVVSTLQINIKFFKTHKTFIETRNIIEQHINKIIERIKNSKYYCANNLLRSKHTQLVNKIIKLTNILMYYNGQTYNKLSFNKYVETNLITKLKEFINEHILQSNILSGQVITNFLYDYRTPLMSRGQLRTYNVDYFVIKIEPLIKHINLVKMYSVNSLKYIEQICEIHNTFVNFSRKTSYLKIDYHSEFIEDMYQNVFVSTNKLISYMHTKIFVKDKKDISFDKDISFNITDFCNLLDIMTKYNIIQIDELCENYISGNLVTGQKIINDDLIGENMITHDNINIIIEYINKKYKISKKSMFNIRINVIMSMYKKILKGEPKKPEAINFLGNNPNNLLFQMDIFWSEFTHHCCPIPTNSCNSALFQKLPLKIKQQIQEIQYLSSLCKHTMTSIKYEPFVIVDLTLENEIKKYLVKKYLSF